MDKLVIDIDETDPAVPAAVAAPIAADVVDEDAAIDPLPKGAVRIEGGKVRLTLRAAVVLKIKSSDGTIREERHETLTFKRLTGADMRAVQAASEAARMSVLFARSTGIRESVFDRLYDRMDAADIDAAARVVEGFFGPSRPTGR